MNQRWLEIDMVKQFVLLGAVLLFALFIFTGIDPGSYVFEPQASNLGNTEGAVTRAREAGSGDVSSDISGNISRSDAPRSSDSSISNPDHTARTSSVSDGANAVRGSATDVEQDLSRLPMAGNASVSPFATSSDIGISQQSAGNQQKKQSRSQTADKTPRKKASDDNKTDEKGNQQADQQDPQNSDGQDGGQGDGNTNGLTTDIAVSGRVLTTDGKTVGQVPLELTLTRAEDEARRAFGGGLRKAVSNEAGEYRFANLVTGEYRICTAESPYFEKGCISARAPQSTADFALRSTSGGHVFGVVTGEGGEPIEGVRVSATQQKSSVSTNANGEYSMNVSVTPNRSYLFYFNKEGYERQRFALRAEDMSGEVQKDVTMARLGGMSLDIMVRDDSGSLVKGQRLRLSSQSTNSAQILACVSNDNGVCTINNVRPADDYRLRVRTQGPYKYDKPVQQPIKVEAGMAPIEVVLTKTSEGGVTLQIVDQDGNPKPGVIMTISVDGRRQNISKTSDTSGQMRFENVPAGRVSFSNSNRSDPRYLIGGNSERLNLTAEKPSIDSGELTIALGGGTNTLKVIVVDENHAHIGGARGALMWSQDKDGINATTKWSTNKRSSEAFGEILFGDIGRGTHTITITPPEDMPGYRVVTKTVEIVSDQEETVMLEKN